ncbi:MAG: ferredoxin [Sulfurovum sp. FS08-3]|nr:MAG: ferredoxin [Sulfurovum sp. FS08-3]
MSSNEITVKIDGKECKSVEGEYILNVARANDIFIPAICYLTRCSPTLACRICLVEADGKRVYACNAKVKDGMEVTVTNEEILQERRAIMEVYDVNHPLQCGVCDQSGECELQNYTLELAVDSQSYAIPDTIRQNKNWSDVLHYDAGLCIVCERCVTVCKDMIGDSAIKTGPRGGEALPKDLKDTMPKDAYAMWNKLQKSIIVPSNGTDFTDCSDCGECTAVCPVGALVSRDFVYKSNAWELKRIPATCAHCSSGCQIYYETKHTSISDPTEKIYRVTNEWNYVSLCGAGRFGYDFENRVQGKDEEAFALAIKAFETAQSIKFNSAITNEEAFMLQRLKEKLGVKLINHDAKAFKDFLTSYAKASGKGLYGGDLKEVMKSDFVISVGASLRNDNPNARYAFNHVQKMNKGAGLYFHPVGDTLVSTFGKSVEIFTHQVGQEELALYLILDLFADKERLDDEIKEYLASFHRHEKRIIKEKIMEEVSQSVTDKETGETKEVIKKVPKTIEKEIEVEVNGLVEMLGGNDAFYENFEKMKSKKESFSLIIGEDLYYHPHLHNLSRLVALIEEVCGMTLVMIPPRTNSLGVAMICDLDEEESGYVIGYNEHGHFRLGSRGFSKLDIPALNQQEGTFTNINKRVVPTNAALDYHGYELNDILNALGIGMRQTIDFTPQLGRIEGFKSQNFDDLPNGYTNAGEELRGYALEVVEVNKEEIKVVKFNESIVINEGEIAYRCNPQRQFNDFTDRSSQINEEFGAYVSPNKAKELGEEIEVIFEQGQSFKLKVIVDDRMQGDIIAIPDYKSYQNVYGVFGRDRYKKVTIKKV